MTEKSEPAAAAPEVMPPSSHRTTNAKSLSFSITRLLREDNNNKAKKEELKEPKEEADDDDRDEEEEDEDEDEEDEEEEVVLTAAEPQFAVGDDADDAGAARTVIRVPAQRPAQPAVSAPLNQPSPNLVNFSPWLYRPLAAFSAAAATAAYHHHLPLPPNILASKLAGTASGTCTAGCSSSR